MPPIYMPSLIVSLKSLHIMTQYGAFNLLYGTTKVIGKYLNVIGK